MLQEILTALQPFSCSKDSEEYFMITSKSYSGKGESHHILPVSIYPQYSKSSWNIVNLKMSDHYRVHELLPYIVQPEHKKKMAYAWKMMCGRTKGEFIDANRYEELKTIRNSEGFACSEEQKLKQSKAMKGRPSPLKGKERPELKGKMSGDKNPMSRSVIVDGVVYKTLTDAATYYKVTKQAVIYWTKNGKAFYVGEEPNTSWKDGRSQKVVIKDIPFETMSEAAKHFDVTTATITNWIKAGKGYKVSNRGTTIPRTKKEPK